VEDVILLTGATGQVGTALLPRLLAEPGTRILALVRARDAAHAAERRTQLLTHVAAGTDPARLDVVVGDVSRPGLGMSAADRARVESDARSIVHAAASVRFDLPAEKAAAENVGGTTAVLELAIALHARGRLLRLDHVSTAYVAGDFSGRFLEENLEVGQGFRNSNEWSKHHSEQLVREHVARGLPVTVHRPSIIVGDSSGGKTQAFNVLYWPLKLYTRGWWRTFPGRQDTVVDVVPVDFVANAVARLRLLPSTLGRTFHVAAGDDARTVGEIAEHVQRITGGPPVRYIDQKLYKRFGRPLVVPFLALTRRGRGIIRGGEAYMPYFVGNPRFDTRQLQDALGAHAKAPPILEYLERVVRYAVDRDFGDA
jgi:thioester reductase-like protein